MLHDLERAWPVWALMRATGWQFLPQAGGLLDQDEALMEDILRIERASQETEEHKLHGSARAGTLIPVGGN